MLKDKTTAIGIGLAGETVGLEFQIRNYTSYLMNGSTQDNQTLTGAIKMIAQYSIISAISMMLMRIRRCRKNNSNCMISFKMRKLH